jgi:hypothetical protein
LLYRATYPLALPSDEASAVEVDRREKRPRHVAPNLAAIDGGWKPPATVKTGG